MTRAKELFGAEHANVQPHSGAQANMAVYFALLEPGDTVMGMELAHGGHLTHGANVNFSGKLYNFVPYGVNKDTELIDYDEVERLAQDHKTQADSGRLQRLRQDSGLSPFPGHRRLGGRLPDGGHGPHFRPDCRRRAPVALPPMPTS